MTKPNFGSIWQALRGVKVSGLEALFLVAALGFAGYVAYFYFNDVQPLNGQIAELKTQMTTLQATQKQERDRLEKLNQQRLRAEQIKNSLFTFESYLRNSNTGMLLKGTRNWRISANTVSGNGNGIIFLPLYGNPNVGLIMNSATITNNRRVGLGLEAMTLDVHVPATASAIDWDLALEVVERAMEQADTVLVELISDPGDPVEGVSGPDRLDRPRELAELQAFCDPAWRSAPKI